MRRHALDNPIWSSLTTDQARFAGDGRLARRYPAAVAPFVGVREHSPAAADELANLVLAGESVYLVALAPPLHHRWTVLAEGNIVQMMWEPARAPSGVPRPDIAPLEAADAADMLALTALVFPGFFRPRTPEMGLYFGIRRDGQLAAMSGERMRLSDEQQAATYQEISAVCTHPDFLGRGYAGALVMHVLELALQHGRKPFLHVNESNRRARDLYERLGFVDRSLLPMWLVRREP
jgi:GNAT superfamily N-acetyltransferase